MIRRDRLILSNQAHIMHALELLLGLASDALPDHDSELPAVEDAIEGITAALALTERTIAEIPEDAAESTSFRSSRPRGGRHR